MTGGSTPVVTCVVVAFHRPDALSELLDGLRHPDVEVIVMNVEDDSAVAEVAGAMAVPLDGNPGYATAVNAGARLAGAQTVLFMNDDLRIGAQTVLQLAAVVASGAADVVVPRVVDHLGRPEPTIAALPTPANLFREWFLLPDRPPALLGGHIGWVQKWRSPHEPEPVDAASAAVVATSATWLAKLPLPEEYFLYWEESDWFWRLHAAGARVLYDPRAVAAHTGGRDDVRPAKSRLLARNAVRCVRRTQGRQAALLAWIVVVLWNVRLVAVDALRRATRPAADAQRLSARIAGLRAALGAWREL